MHLLRPNHQFYQWFEPFLYTHFNSGFNHYESRCGPVNIFDDWDKLPLLAQSLLSNRFMSKN